MSFDSPNQELTGPLLREDYNFSEVTEKLELEGCYFYEYARESRIVRKEAASVQRQKIESAGKAGRLHFGSNVQKAKLFHQLLITCLPASFPQKPWQLCSREEQVRFCTSVLGFRRMELHQRTWKNPSLTLAVNEHDSTTFTMWKEKYFLNHPKAKQSGPVVFGFFAINLGVEDEPLLEEFRISLGLFKGTSVPEILRGPKKVTRNVRTGRQSFRDALNRLGALRLSYHLRSFRPAHEIMRREMSMKTGNTCPLFYADRKSFRRACELAAKHFSYLFGALDPSEPLHFRSPGQK